MFTGILDPSANAGRQDIITVNAARMSSVDSIFPDWFHAGHRIKRIDDCHLVYLKRQKNKRQTSKNNILKEEGLRRCMQGSSALDAYDRKKAESALKFC